MTTSWRRGLEPSSFLRIECAQGLDGNVKHTKRGLAVALTVLALFVLCRAQTFGQQGSQQGEQAEIGPSIVLLEVRPGPGVARIFLLSDLDSGLAGTVFDTPVFEFADEAGQADGVLYPDGANHTEGELLQPALFVCAGTHENEIAGILAAYWLIEKSRVHGAKLFVMPRANAAGAHGRRRILSRRGYCRQSPVSREPSAMARGFRTSRTKPCLIRPYFCLPMPPQVFQLWLGRKCATSTANIRAQPIAQ